METELRRCRSNLGSLGSGVIAFDFGIFTLSISDQHGVFIVLYLLGAHAFSGLVDILRAREAREFDAPNRKNSLAEGIANIGVAVVTVVFGLVFGNMQSLTRQP